MDLEQFKKEIEFYNGLVEGIPTTIERIVDQINENNVAKYGDSVVHKLCKACEVARDRGTFTLSLPSEFPSVLNELIDDNYVIEIYREFKNWFPKTCNKKFERLEDQIYG